MSMIIYNITIKPDWSIDEEWLQWMLTVHVPEIMATGCFEKYQAARLLDVDDEDGPAYTFQYYAASKEDYNQYEELFAPALRKLSAEKWGGQFIAFRSLMQVVH